MAETTTDSNNSLNGQSGEEIIEETPTGNEIIDTEYEEAKQDIESEKGRIEAQLKEKERQAYEASMALNQYLRMGGQRSTSFGRKQTRIQELVSQASKGVTEEDIEKANTALQGYVEQRQTQFESEVNPKLDAEAAEKLKGFKFYEGLGLAMGDFKSSDYKLKEGSGIGSYFYSTGKYKVYDPESGSIKEYMATPVSSRKGYDVYYGKQRVEGLEQLKDFAFAGKEVIGQKFDISKYLKNPSYDVQRDASGNITKITAKPVQYTKEKDGSNKRYATYVPEEIIVSGGKVQKVITRDTYRPWISTSGSRYKREVYDAKVTTYDSNGLLSSFMEYDNVDISKDNPREKVVEEVREVYKDGVLVLRNFQDYTDGKKTYERTSDYLKGQETTKTGSKSSTAKIATIEMPTAQEAEVIRKYGATGAIDIVSDFMALQPGEKPYEEPLSFTDATGNIYTVYQPKLKKELLGEEKVFWGTKEGATDYFKDVGVIQKPEAVELAKYRQRT
jgi:hypothetical protein